MTRSRLVATSDLSGLSPVLVDGITVSTRYERLREAIDAQMLDAASLFAEPVLGAATPTGFRNASWYSVGEGECIPLGDLPRAEQTAAIARLKRALNELADLIGEEPFGGWLRAAFVIPDSNCIRVIGGRPTLINWGFVPANLPQTDAALEQHFVNTIGDLVGWKGLPRRDETGRVEVPKSISVTAPPDVTAESDKIAAPVEAISVPPVEPVGVPPPPPTAAPSTPVAPPGVRRWRFFAGGIALFFIGILIGLVLVSVRGSWPGGGSADSGAKRLEEGVRRNLLQQKDRLQSLLKDDVCRLPPDQLPGRSMDLPTKPSQPVRSGSLDVPRQNEPPHATGSHEAVPVPTPLPAVRTEEAASGPATPAPRCETAEAPAQVMLVMDTSRSMQLPAGNRPDLLSLELAANTGDPESILKFDVLMREPGRKRMDDARNAALEFVDSLSTRATVGIAAFHARCDARIYLQPTLDRNEARQVIDGLKSLSGTPIAAALRKVREAFDTNADPDAPRSVILITDGHETCKGDPCAEARALAKSYKNLRIHVIDVTGTSQLQCVAEAGAGTIVRASDLTALKAAVAQAATDVHWQMNCPAPKSLQKSATPETHLPVTPGADEKDSPRVLSAPKRQPGSPASTPGKEAGGALNLNQQLERATALVIAPEAGSMGSAFFIAPDLLVTSRHVIQGAGGPTRNVLVTSRALERPLRGEVVIVSDGTGIGRRDYAVIRLRDTPAHPPVVLPFARSVEKRVTVIAAGYPGYLVQNDPAMKRLTAGDLSAAPELVLSEGKVQVTHKSQVGVPLVVHSADISQGNSGGPLVDSCGRVVAINTFIGLDPDSGRRGLYSLGSDDLQDFLELKGIKARLAEGTCDPS